MSAQAMLEVLKWAWAYVPFPWLFLGLLAAAALWLWVEYQFTRLGRSTPGWRRPLPVLPEISAGAAFAIRLSWIILRLWVLLYLVVAVTGLAAREGGVDPGLQSGLLALGDYWRQGYGWLLDLLPGDVSERIGQAISLGGTLSALSLW